MCRSVDIPVRIKQTTTKITMIYNQPFSFFVVDSKQIGILNMPYSFSIKNKKSKTRRIIIITMNKGIQSEQTSRSERKQSIMEHNHSNNIVVRTTNQFNSVAKSSLGKSETLCLQSVWWKRILISHHRSTYVVVDFLCLYKHLLSYLFISLMIFVQITHSFQFLLPKGLLPWSSLLHWSSG